MTARRLILPLLVLVGLSGIALLLYLAPKANEHIVQGKPLRDWVVIYGNAVSNDPDLPRAKQILIDTGTNLIPTLLDMLRASESPVKTKALDLIARLRLFHIRHVPAERLNWGGNMGFSVLGTNASPALPALLKIYDQKISPSSQADIANIFRRIGPPAKEAIPSLLREITNSNEDVRLTATHALGRIHQDAPAVVPALVKSLTDPLPVVRAAAASALGYFGPEARDAIPAISQAIKGTHTGWYPSNTLDPRQAQMLEALRKIDPAAADKLEAELQSPAK